MQLEENERPDLGRGNKQQYGQSGDGQCLGVAGVGGFSKLLKCISCVRYVILMYKMVKLEA